MWKPQADRTRSLGFCLFGWKRYKQWACFEFGFGFGFWFLYLGRGKAITRNSIYMKRRIMSLVAGNSRTIMNVAFNGLIFFFFLAHREGRVRRANSWRAIRSNKIIWFFKEVHLSKYKKKKTDEMKLYNSYRSIEESYIFYLWFLKAQPLSFMYRKFITAFLESWLDSWPSFEQGSIFTCVFSEHLHSGRWVNHSDSLVLVGNGSICHEAVQNQGTLGERGKGISSV